MIPRKLTGNEAVDAMAAMAVAGNVIPATWYKTITTPSGKADLVAINILSDVLYWYRPREVRDEYTGDVVAYQKRFAADYLQRSYEQLSEHFGISKRQAKDAVVRLEELGAIRRIFRNVESGAGMMGNVMFIAIMPKRIYELTFPEQAPAPDPMTKKRHSYDGEGPDPGTPMSEFRHRYGENSPDIYKDYSKTTERLSSDHPTNQPERLSCDKEDGGLAETSDEFERAWEKVPRSKASQCAKEKAWRVWGDTLVREEVDEGFLAKTYRRYVIQQENAGTEQRFIATLSTWLKPNRPIAGLSLESAISERRDARARLERQRAAQKAETELMEREAAIREQEAAWRESDPRAQELWARAWDFRGGFGHMGDAMHNYQAYRDEKFKPG
ncbi:MAG: hypothetical protein IJO87_10630 [Eggerthellaceae bacterium]|nr:hypothetical protein [Eggerthellaceae bacterium]